jgi:Zn-dependent peptidase ImmA (M78 family)
MMEIENDAFSGMNGLVNERPYIIVNSTMNPERIRSTIAHEMAHFIFQWSDDMEEKQVEERATSISGAFLFPAADARRELGVRRSAVTKDMSLTCKEYGISMYLLVKRANLCGIINDNVARAFYIKAGQAGWRKKEPSRIEKEEPTLFMQLVFRAVSENEISVQKGAELLKESYEFVLNHCFTEEE